jgi:hypothetical protein
MRFRRLKLSLVIFVSILIAVGLIWPAVNSALWKWPELGSDFHDVDINTGRTRQIRYLLYCKTSKKIEDSVLTRTIGRFPNDLQPNWQLVNTLPIIGRRYSPHYAYHGAISQIRQVELIWQLCSFSDEAKKHMARTILDRWQSGRGYFGAGSYIHDVWDIAREKTESDPKAIISLADLLIIQNEK